MCKGITMGISSIAAVASLASVGFGAAGSVVSGAGTAAGDTYKAETLDRAAQYGDLKQRRPAPN